MNGTKRAAIALLALLVLAPIAEGAGIFLPVTDAGAPSMAAISDMDGRSRNAVHPQLVRVAHAELAKARDQATLSGSGSLLFNLDRNIHLRGIIERTAPTLGGYSLSGRIKRRGGGFVTLAVHDGAVAGSIWTPDASYEILPRGGGLHIVQQAPNTHRCAGAIADRDAHIGHSTFAQSAGEVDDGLNTVVDVLVVWTPEREDQAGGEAEVRTEIDFWVAYANDAFERSGAFVTLNLVGAERVDYVEAPEPGAVTDLNRLSLESDGHMDDVHDRRDALRADLVSLAVAKGAGIAHLDGAFNVARHHTTFIHEVGHNFGIRHDRYNQPWPSSGFEHDVGRVILNRRRCNPTIMAYGTQCLHAGLRDNHIPYFSSPRRYDLSGAALGVWKYSDIRNTDGSADAVALLNRKRHAVAAFR